jgi:hypothetical protein
VPRHGLSALFVCLLVLTGCQVGERPSFSDDPFGPGAITGDTSIDSVLAKFDSATTGPATAAYSVLRKYGALEYTSIAVLAGNRRSITIGNTRFVQIGSATETCTVDKSSPCMDGLVPQAASDVGLTIEFYAADTAKRLRRDAQAMIGPSVLHDETFVDQHATCVDVPLPGGTAVYCVLDNGLLAKLDDGDVLVTLTLWSESIDEGAFATGG